MSVSFINPGLVIEPAWRSFVALSPLTHQLALGCEVALVASAATAIGSRFVLSLRQRYIKGVAIDPLWKRLFTGQKVPQHDKDDVINARQSVNDWAYNHSRILRLSQSPVFNGVLLAGIGALLAHTALLYPGPLAHGWSLNARLQENRAPVDRPLLLRERGAWLDLYEKGSWSPMSEWMPTAPPNQAVIRARQSSEIVGQSMVIALGGFALFIAGSLLAFSKWYRESVGDREHGRAAWAARSEVRFEPKGYFKLPMRVSQRGKREWEDTYNAPWTVLAPSPAANSSHGILLGPTGSGKGAYTLGHFFATATVPILYQDGKGETPARHLRPEMLRFGIPAKKPKGLPSMRFDPIGEIKKGATENERADRARDLANLLIPAPKDGQSENSWIKETAQPLLAEGLLRGRWQHMGELADEVAGRKLPRILHELGLPEGWMFGLEGKNAMEYAANEISNNTQPYLRGWPRHAFSASDFELEDVFTKGCYIMSATEDDQQKIPIRLFWNLLWARAQRSDKKMPCLVLIDEAVAAGRIPGIIEATVKLRDRGFSIWMAFQTYAGIETVYGKSDAETLRRALVNSIVLINGLDPKDAQEVTRELGNYTHTEKNKQSGTTSRTAFPLMPLSDLNDLAGQENEFWGIFRGRGVTSKGRPIIAKLNAIEPGMWNCLATDEEWEEQEKMFGHCLEIQSRYRFLLDPAFIRLSQRVKSERDRTELELLASEYGLDGLEDRAVKLLLTSETLEGAVGKELAMDGIHEDLDLPIVTL